jgi:hypothetical protein
MESLKNQSPLERHLHDLLLHQKPSAETPLDSLSSGMAGHRPERLKAER